MLTNCFIASLALLFYVCYVAESIQLKLLIGFLEISLVRSENSLGIFSIFYISAGGTFANA